MGAKCISTTKTHFESSPTHLSIPSYELKLFLDLFRNLPLLASFTISVLNNSMLRFSFVISGKPFLFNNLKRHLTNFAWFAVEKNYLLQCSHCVLQLSRVCCTKTTLGVKHETKATEKAVGHVSTNPCNQNFPIFSNFKLNQLKLFKFQKHAKSTLSAKTNPI